MFLQIYGVVPADFSAPTLVTSMFLHGSWLHVIGNMWYLWIFGDNVEDRSGTAASSSSTCCAASSRRSGRSRIDPDSTLPTIGASGAIAGVMGAYFVLYPHSRVLTLIPLIFYCEIIELPAILLLGFWFLMQLFSAGAIAVTASHRGGRRGVHGARRRLRGGRRRRVRVQAPDATMAGRGFENVRTSRCGILIVQILEFQDSRILESSNFRIAAESPGPPARSQGAAFELGLVLAGRHDRLARFQRLQLGLELRAAPEQGVQLGVARAAMRASGCR